MAVAVCCPTCWKWSELKTSTMCKRCGTPLVMGDGRRVDEAALAPPGVIPAPPPYAFNAPMATLAPPQPVGFNWVALARWITVGYGSLAVLALIVAGLVLPYITVPVQDPTTGGIVDETLNLRPALLVIAIVVAIVFGVFAWLTGYVLARVLLLILMAIGVVSTIARLAGEPSAAFAETLVGAVFEAGFAFVLIMSLLAPQRAA